MSYQYFGQKLLFDDIQLVLIGDVNQNILANIPFNLIAASADGMGKFPVPIWHCRATIGIKATGSALNSGSVDKVVFNIGHINPDGSFSGSATANMFPSFVLSGSGTGAVEKVFQVFGIARVTGSAIFDFNKLALQILIIGEVSGVKTPATLRLYHRRGLADTYIRPIFFGSQ